MSRPRYETVDDRKREEKVMRYCSRAWGLEYHKLPDRYEIDYMVTKTDGELHGFAEVKCRDNPQSKYPTFFVSAAKFREGVELCGFWMVPLVIIVKWSDKLGYFHHTPGKDYLCYEVRWGGRTDRGDKQDEEPMVHIENSEFRIIRDLK